jgi:hypothetical protein
MGNLVQVHRVADVIYCIITLLTEELTNYTGTVTVKWTSVTEISCQYIGGGCVPGLPAATTVILKWWNSPE